MDLVVLDTAGPGLPGELILLADEMEEDPRCHLVALGADDGGAMLITIWQPEVAEEVASSLRDLPYATSVRRLPLASDLAAWD